MITTFRNKAVYYEVHGSGEPLILLNGIMMSTQSWQQLLPAYQSYQVILIDLFDQGQTEVNENYTIEDQGDLVCHIIKKLTLEQVHVIGISYGGEVAMDVAIKLNERVKTLQLFNTTAYTDPQLFNMGEQWMLLTKTYQGDAFYDATIPNIYGETFKKQNHAWMMSRTSFLKTVFNTPSFLDKMHRLTQSSQYSDYREKLKQLKMPVLIVSGGEDCLIPIHYQQEINKHITHASHVIIEHAGHAMMYENPEIFNSLVIGFIESSKYQIKL
jgi:pimeloyl-ACP methyl ester carboxylesterase